MIGNLKDTFRLPVSILRRMDSDAVTEVNLRDLGIIYEKEPSYLDFSHLRASMANFLRDLDPENCLHYHHGNRWQDQLTKQQFRRIMR